MESLINKLQKEKLKAEIEQIEAITRLTNAEALRTEREADRI